MHLSFIPGDKLLTGWYLYHIFNYTGHFAGCKFLRKIELIFEQFEQFFPFCQEFARGGPGPVNTRKPVTEIRPVIHLKNLKQWVKIKKTSPGMLKVNQPA